MSAMNICFESPEQPFETAVALGTFDGLHLGHRQLVKQMFQAAQKHQLQPWVYTFQNHPAHVLRPDKAPQLLTLWPEKSTLLQNDFELSGIVFQPFDAEFSRISAEDFVRHILFDKLKVRHISVGYNFRFGHEAQGDAALLKSLGAELGIEVAVMPAYEVGGEPVSSTRIRALVRTGQLPEALELLGGHYLVQGRVIRGQGIATGVLGVPTANLELNQELKLLPPKGVYACWVRRAAQSQLQPGVFNLGMRPTFSGQDLSLEVFIMDFEGDLYEQELEVYPRHFIRPEQRFDGPEALKAQIHRDIDAARSTLMAQQG